MDVKTVCKCHMLEIMFYLKYLHVEGGDPATVPPLLLLHQCIEDGVGWNPDVSQSLGSSQQPQEHIWDGALGLLCSRGDRL